MGRHCVACVSEHSSEIDRKLKAGVSNADVARYLASKGVSITPQAIGRHAKEHLAVVPVRGRRPTSDDFLTNVRDAAADALEAGELAVTLKDGIAAQKALDARQARDLDRDWQLKLIQALTGKVHIVRVIDPEQEALEGEFRPLLNPGAE